MIDRTILAVDDEAEGVEACADGFGEILGKSAAPRKVLENIRRAAATDFDVLITGETGTGKELAARAIHRHGPRRDAPFVPVDCGAVSEDLMESEFYGYERGAFTGAQIRKVGLMESADSGTFFMDEIAQMPMRLQAKLLRVLQERKLRRVGGIREIDLDARIVAASSVSLHEAVQRGRFRLELYHRLNVVRIELPPLRERVDDIPLLVEHFLQRYTREMKGPPVEASPEMMRVLTGYSWPGNVRELQNLVKRLLALSNRSVLTLEDLPEDIVAQAGPCSARNARSFFALRERRVADFEKQHLQNLLDNCRGDVAAATRESQLPRATLYRLLKKYDLNPADFRSEEAPTKYESGNLSPECRNLRTLG
jgi:DNA-binding NtrC family response regulator